MAITICAELEARLRQRAEAEGLTVPAYLDRLVQADQTADEDLEALALEGLNSGDPIPVGPGYWEEKHRRLDERLKRPALGERKPFLGPIAHCAFPARKQRVRRQYQHSADSSAPFL